MSVLRVNRALRNVTAWVGHGWESKKVAEEVRRWGITRIKQVMGDLQSWWEGGKGREERGGGEGGDGVGWQVFEKGEGGRVVDDGACWEEEVAVSVGGGSWWGAGGGQDVRGRAGCPPLEGQGVERLFSMLALDPMELSKEGCGGLTTLSGRIDLGNSTVGSFDFLRFAFRPRDCSPNLAPEHRDYVTMRVGGEWRLDGCEVASCHGKLADTSITSQP
jgi:hypothetical protein